MAKLASPKITVTFTELGITAITRGTKGTVAIIVRDAAADKQAPVVLTQAGQTPTTLGVENQNYIKRAFLGYVNPPKKVIVYTAPVEGDPDLTEALTYMATQDFDYLVGPADCTAAEAGAIYRWIKSQRANGCVKYKAVLPRMAADHSAVVNFTTEQLFEGKAVYTTEQFCSRIAGLIAGTPMKISATYAPLPELTDVSRISREKQDEAIGKGELIAIWDGRKAKLSRAVTSLVTTSQGMLDSFKKIKLVEIMDLIRTDIHSTAEDEYIGKYANTYDNKMLLVAAIRGYFEGLRRDELVQPGYTVDIDVEAQEQYLMSQGKDTSEMSEQAIREANTGSHVFLVIRCKILDAIEDIDINIEI